MCYVHTCDHREQLVLEVLLHTHVEVMEKVPHDWVLEANGDGRVAVLLLLNTHVEVMEKVSHDGVFEGDGNGAALGVIKFVDQLNVLMVEAISVGVAAVITGLVGT